MKVFTIGFTKTTAENFFERLKKAGVKRVVDVRLNNVSQLSAFAKKDDLRYFLKAICGVDYSHQPVLAPTQPMLDAYKKNDGSWDTYQTQFLELMTARRIEDKVSATLLEDGCLLCSEDKPHQCHRRLVAEYLKGKWGNLEVVHL